MSTKLRPDMWFSNKETVYGPGPDNPPGMKDFENAIKDMKKKKLVSEHINVAVDEIKAARAAAFEDIKIAADSGDIGEIRAILDMIDDLESVQEQLEAWQ